MNSTLFLQVFWASLILVGLGVLAIVIALARKIRFLQKFVDYFVSLPLLFSIFILIALGFATLSVASVPAYFFKFRVEHFTYTYIFLLMLGVTVAVVRRKSIAQYVRRKLADMSATEKWLLSGLLLVLVTDFAFSLFIGAPLWVESDAYVHIAKYNLIASNIFTLQDPFFANGVVESRYHVNVMHAVYALAQNVSGASATEVWSTSLAWFRLVMWLSIFSVSYAFLPKAQKTWSYILTAATVALYGSIYFHANYPNVTVLSWGALFLIGALRLVKKNDPTLIIIGSLLIGLTHPSYALIAGAFLGLLTVVLLVSKQLFKSFWTLLAITISGIFLVAPILITMHFPSNFTDAGFTVPDLRLFGQGFFRVAARGNELLPVNIAVVFMSVLGYIFLLKKNTDKATRAVLVSCIVLYALIAYNPVALSVIGDTLPLWVLARFKDLNRIGLFSPMLGVLWLAQIASKKVNETYVTYSLVALLLVALGFIATPRYKTFIELHTVNAKAKTDVADLTHISNDMRGHTIIADEPVGYSIPAVSTAKVIDISEFHVTPMANIKLRIACGKYLRNSFDYYALRAAGVDRVVITKKAANYQLLRSKDYFRKLNGSGNYEIYALTNPQTPPENLYAESICIVPYGE